MLDMNELFERFVTERLRRALRGRLDVKGHHQDRLDKARSVTIKPDLLFSANRTPRFVADIKYKLTDDTAAGRNTDYYQLLAYTTALDLPEGVLIYCLDANRTDDSDSDGASATTSQRESSMPTEGTPDESLPGLRSIRVRNVEKVLHTYALDLSGTAENVARNLDRLADWIEDRAAASVMPHASTYG